MAPIGAFFTTIFRASHRDAGACFLMLPRDPDGHRTRRSQAVRQGARLGIIARVISVTCTLAQVPIALAHLGAEGFGLWMTLTSIAGFLMLADVGLGLGAKTLMARELGRDDPSAVRALTRETFRQLLPVSGLLAALSLPLAWAFDWAALFGVTSPSLSAQLPWALLGLGLTTAVTLLSSPYPALAAAVQLTSWQHIAAAAGGVLTLIAVAVSAALHAPWLVLVLVVFALPLVINVALGWALVRKLGWRGPPPARLPRDRRRELRRLGALFFVPQAGSLFANLSLPIAIAAAGGPVAVTAFNLLQRIFGLLGQLQWMSFSALWPAYTEALARADHGWVRQTYRRSWRATLGVFVPGLLLLAIALPWLVQIWIGTPPPGLSSTLVLVSAGWFLLQLLGQPPAMLLNGMGEVRGVALYGTAGHLVSLAGMFIGGRVAGAPGVVAGMASGYVLVGLPGILIETQRRLRRLPA